MIHLECKPDVALLKKLTGLGRKGINHAGSKSEVVKGVEKENKALGLVDQDPFAIQPKAMNNYQPYRSFDQAKIKVLKRGDRFLIILCPRLEEWIIKAAREVEIDIKNYGLPQSGEKLHEEINNRLDKFERLLGDIQEAPRIEELKKILKSFLDGIPHP